MRGVFFLLGILLLCPPALAAPVNEKAVAVASQYLGIEEKTGRNDGPEVERFLAAVGLGKGQPWCAAFVVYSYGAAAKPAANPLPKIARVALLWQRAGDRPSRYRLIEKDDLLTGLVRPQPGDIAIWLYGSGPNPNGHTGLLRSGNRLTLQTIEGNTMPTNSGNQREGGGVYARERRTSSLVGLIRVRP